MRIVATSGCFDVLHAGHVSLLSRMRELAGEDGLVIVLLNKDDYVRRAKGDGRPVNKLEHRMAVLLALRAVDIVLPFGADEPSDMIHWIEPDIWMKGPEYAGQEIPEIAAMAGHGGEVLYHTCGGDTGALSSSDILKSR